MFPSLAALAEITEMVAQLHGTMIKMENFQKLHELKKDLIGIDNLVIPGRVSSCALSCIGNKDCKCCFSKQHLNDLNLNVWNTDTPS